MCTWAGPLLQNAGATQPLAQGLAGFDENYAETSVPEKRGYACVCRRLCVQTFVCVYACVRIHVCAHTCVCVCVRAYGTCVLLLVCEWVRVFALHVHLMSAPNVYA